MINYKPKENLSICGLMPPWGGGINLHGAIIRTLDFFTIFSKNMTDIKLKFIGLKITYDMNFKIIHPHKLALVESLWKVRINNPTLSTSQE